jgi:hypothetical protein
VETNRRRSRAEPEHELVDTGVFAEGRYFDVTVEYAKAGPHDTLIEITVHNRRPERASLHVLPTLWLRNTWAWWPAPHKPQMARTCWRSASRSRPTIRHRTISRCMSASSSSSSRAR